MAEQYIILEWDSNFFGLKVARLTAPVYSESTLGNLLHGLKEEGVVLVYWASDPHDVQSQAAAQAFNGFLADRKTTFIITAENIKKQLASEKAKTLVEEYAGLYSTPELEDLALQAGIFSRFKLDPRIPESRFNDLYKLWIQRSVNKTLAENVFVVKQSGKVVGMVTVGTKNGRGDIGLIAVDDSMRGKNIGISLVQAALKWALDKGFSEAQVVTQGENKAACRLYEKCGYRIDTVENIYHFWI